MTPQMLASYDSTIPQTRKPLALTQMLVYAVTLLVPCIFYLLLVRTSLNLPLIDDYDSVLGFLNHYSQLPGAGQKLLYMLTAQHNEHKLIFENIIFVLQYHLFGHANFQVLGTLVNLFILPLAIALWKMFLPQMRDTFRRLVLFLPVIFLLFQFEYYENLNWAEAGLQHIPVLPFFLFTLYFLLRKDRLSIGIALLMFVLAVAASGNGFFLFPVGLLILCVQKRWPALAAWVCTTALLLAGYYFRYVLPPNRPGANQSILVKLFSHFKLAYFISFLGSAAENIHHFPFRGAATILGIAFLAWFLYACRRGYYRRNPYLISACLFILLTALAVAGLRADLNVAQSLASRYRMYSDLLLIFVYIFTVEEFLQYAIDKPSGRRIYAGILFATFVFWSANIWLGYRAMMIHRHETITGMQLYLYPPATATTVEGPVIFSPDEDMTDPRVQQFAVRSRSILAESKKLGIYEPDIKN
jgi:hypothetical protein